MLVTLVKNTQIQLKRYQLATKLANILDIRQFNTVLNKDISFKKQKFMKIVLINKFYLKLKYE